MHHQECTNISSWSIRTVRGTKWQPEKLQKHALMPWQERLKSNVFPRTLRIFAVFSACQKLLEIINVCAKQLMSFSTIAFRKSNMRWSISFMRKHKLRKPPKKEIVNWSNTHSFIIKSLIVIWRVILRAYVNEFYCSIGFVSFFQHVYLYKHESKYRQI